MEQKKQNELFEELLVEELDSKHLCPICSSLLWSPLQCKNGHVCCKDDWSKIIKDKKCCFQCRIDVKTLDVLGKNIYLEDEIRGLEIHCPNSNKNPERKENITGCQDKFTIDSLETHLKKCLYQLTECKYSKECGLIKRIDLEEHYSNCGFRLVKCECGQEMIVKSKGDHQTTVCPVFIIDCPDCLIGFKRNEFEKHFNECKEKLISCPYSDYSCGAKIKRKELPTHYIKVDHLLMVKNKADSLENQIQQLSIQNKILRQQLSDLNAKKKFSSKWNIRNWSEKVKKYPQGQFFTSSVFNVSSTKKFFIKVFPNGQDTKKLSVSLCKSYDTKSKINFSFEIQNQDITKSVVQEETFLFAKGTSDYYTIVFYEDLSDPGFFINNTLIIGFNINIEKVYSEHLISN